MNQSQFNRMSLRMGCACALLVAIFWGVWSLFAPVPGSQVLEITQDFSLTIPFSRWFDVPFVFLMFYVYAYIINLYLRVGSRYVDRDDMVTGLVFGFGVGLVFGFGVGLVYGLVYGLVFGFGVGLKILFTSIWRKIWDFLMAKEDQKSI